MQTGFMPTTTANMLTFLRIGLIPVLIALFYIDEPFSYISASIIFLIACLTDYFDGVMARRQQQESNLGKFLDPLADKLIIAAAIIMLAGFDRISGLTLIPGVIILCREMFQMFGIGFLTVGDALPIFPFYPIGFACFWAAAILTLITGYDYLKQSLRQLK